jgi:hypothetical protein
MLNHGLNTERVLRGRFGIVSAPVRDTVLVSEQGALMVSRMPAGSLSFPTTRTLQSLPMTSIWRLRCLQGQWLELLRLPTTAEEWLRDFLPRLPAMTR